MILFTCEFCVFQIKVKVDSTVSWGLCLDLVKVWFVQFIYLINRLSLRFFLKKLFNQICHVINFKKNLLSLIN